MTDSSPLRALRARLLPPALDGEDALERIRADLARTLEMFRAVPHAMLAAATYISHVRTLLLHVEQMQQRLNAVRTSHAFYLDQIRRVIARLEQLGVLDEARTLNALTRAMHHALRPQDGPPAGDE